LRSCRRLHTRLFALRRLIFIIARQVDEAGWPFPCTRHAEMVDCLFSVVDVYAFLEGGLRGGSRVGDLTRQEITCIGVTGHSELVLILFPNMF
jgi:hypothetical protein